MRKALIFLCFAFALGASVTATGTKIEIWLLGWTNEMGRIAQELVDERFTPETGIIIDVKPLAYADAGNKVLLALASRDTPDIISCGTDVADLALRGGLIDLAAFKPDEYAELEQKLFSSVMGPFTFEARRFALPSDVSCLVAAYRTDILADLGMEIPQTWEEVTSAQPKALARGKTFAFMRFDEMWAFYCMITQYGGNFFSSDGFSSALDRPESVEAFKAYVELFTKHGFPKEVVGVTPFIEGEQILYVDGLWLYPTIETVAPQLKGKWQVSLLPGVERDGKLYNGSSPGSVLLGISTYSKHKEEAWEFLKWFLGTDVLTEVANQVLAKGSGYMWLPANKVAMQNVNLPEDVKKVYFDQIEACIPIPYGVNAGVQFRYVVFAIQNAVLQGVDPEKAILDAAKAMNDDMARRKVEYKRFLDEFDRQNAKPLKQ